MSASEPEGRNVNDGWSAQPNQDTPTSGAAHQPAVGSWPAPPSQPPYRQPPTYGQTPVSGAANYGQATYGQTNYGQTNYGQGHYGQGHYGAPNYGPAPHSAYGPTVGSSPYAASVPTTVAAPRRRGRRIFGATLAALAIAAAGGGVGAAAVGLSNHQQSTAGTKATAASAPVQTVVNSANASITTLVKAVDPVVVSLTVEGGNEEDQGSGIVLQSTGVILTNNHVISAAEDGGTIEVTFTDGTSAPATIVAADASEDLAIVKASGVSGLPTATLADSDSVQVGDTVVAIGNELGLPNSVSSGIVSALHRKVSVASDDNTPMLGGRNFNGQNSSGTTYGDAIQTDAAINQGDSGGALFNMQGQVIGIDSAIATGDSGSSGSVGIGFAIAINDAQAFIKANS